MELIKKDEKKKIDKENKDKLVEEQIGDEDPIPIFPMDDNPGEIKPDDMEKIREIYKNPGIPNDPKQCNKKKSNDIESKGKLADDKKNINIDLNNSKRKSNDDKKSIPFYIKKILVKKFGHYY